MFIGHIGIGFAAKAIAPRTSLGSLFLASQFLDILWPILLLLGIESVLIVPDAPTVIPLEFTNYPFSHSLAFVVLWSVLFAVLYFVLKQDKRGSLVMGLVVASHWLLDALVHVHDLQLYPGSDVRVGMGLWSSLAATLLMELGIFLIGLAIYLRTTLAGDHYGSCGLRLFVLFIFLVYAANLFGPTPPHVSAIAWTNLSIWLLVAWGYWIDRHRRLS